MHTEVALTTPVREFLEGLNVPIRVLNGSAGIFQPSPSWRGQARDNNATLEECQRDGVTIVSWGTDALESPDVPYEYRGEVPSDLYDNPPRIGAGREWIQPPINDQTIVVDGTPIARIGERTVWTTLPLDSTGLPLDGLNMQRYLGDAIERARTFDPEEEGREERERLARETFLRNATSRIDTEKQRLSRQIEDITVNITSYERDLMRFYQDRNTKKTQLDAYENIDTATEQHEQEWDRLVNHPRITRIESDANGSIIIFTDEITMTHPRRAQQSVYLGRFKMTFPNTGDEYGILLDNLDNKRNGYSHPHVSGTSPCFGDIHSLVTTMWSERQYAALFEVCLQYLESWNPQDSYGAHARYWLEDPEPQNQDQPAPPVTPAASGAATPMYNSENLPTDYEPLEGCDCEACEQARGR